MQKLTDVGPVEVFSDWGSVDARRNSSIGFFESLKHPWGVVGGSVVSLEDFVNTINNLDAMGSALELWEGFFTIANTVGVVGVDSSRVIHDFNQSSLASYRNTIIWVVSSIVAAKLLDAIMQVIFNEDFVISKLDEGGGCVVGPISYSISNHESLEIWLEYSIVSSVLGVVLVDVVRDQGHIDASIRLSGDIKVVTLELWELLIPCKDGIQVVLGRGCVVKGSVSLSLTVGVTYSCWRLNVKHVRF